MDFWREFFVLNLTIIQFVHGLVFFVLGLAIIWQSRRHSRLDLARSLSWLGAFGLMHGLQKWGNIFIPIQQNYLNPAWIDTLSLTQIFLLACSFACLFQFGVEALYSLYPRLGWLQAIPGGVLLIWVTVFMWRSQTTGGETEQLVISADIWSRYLLGLPGGLVAALGLRQQAQQQAQLREFARISRTFQVASLALAAYAIVGGLFGPMASFFPANVVNAGRITGLLGIQPEVLGSLCGLALAISVVRGLEIFEVEIDRRIEEMELNQILQTERERVSRELHDGAIQRVYTAGLIAESIRKQVDPNNPMATRLDRIISALHDTIRDLRQFIVELEPNLPGDNLVDGLRRLTEDPHLRSLLKVELMVDCGEDNCFSASRAIHVLAIAGESLSNIARHAHARHAWLHARRSNGQLVLSITDDGAGFSDQYVPGFGLRNMRDRARMLGGQLQIEPNLPQGAQITLTVPWEDLR